MKKILDILDFAKGKKTQISGVFLFVSIVINLIWKIDVSEKELTDIFFELTKQTEILLSVYGCLYGLFMKSTRLFR